MDLLPGARLILPGPVLMALRHPVHRQDILIKALLRRWADMDLRRLSSSGVRLRLDRLRNSSMGAVHLRADTGSLIRRAWAMFPDSKRRWICRAQQMTCVPR